MDARLPDPIDSALALGRIGALLRAETLLLYERVQVLRGVLFPWWRQRVQAKGLEHVRAGIEEGKGVILWVQPCLGSNVFVKQALFEAGLPLAHLTRPAHGFSSYPFGVRLMNPLLRRAENRYLAERVVMDDDRTVGPLRRLRVLLRENQVTSIAVTSAAVRLGELPMLEGVVSLPEGPAVLAANAGAAILPVFTVGSAGTAVVEIGAPLPVSGTGTDGVRACQRALVEWLAEQISEHPLDWLGWRQGLYRRANNESDQE